MTRRSVLLGIGVAAFSMIAAADDPPPFDGTPAREPVLFALGVVSTGDYELNAAFTADGRTVYFCVTNPVFPFPNTYSTIVSGLGDVCFVELAALRPEWDTSEEPADRGLGRSQ